MKVHTRISLFILISVFLVINLDFVFVQAPAQMPAAIASTLPASTVTPTATATEPPTLSEIIAQTEKSVFDPIVALLNFAAALLITFLVFFLVRRIWRLSHTSNLLIDPFKNSTGNDELDKVLPGLTQLTRERLVQVLEQVGMRIEYYKNLRPDPNHSPAKFPVPEGVSDERLTNLLKSLQDVATGEVKTAVQLLNLIFLPRGTKVTTNLQSRGDMPATVGISLEVTDLQGQQEPTLYTIWEQPNASASTSNLQSSAAQTVILSPQPATQSGVATLDPVRQQAQPYYELGVLLDKLGLFEDAIRYLEGALKRDPKFDGTTKALVASVSHLLVQQGAASAYAIGKQLQDANQIPPAIESYKKALSIADQADAEAAWRTVLKLTTGDEAAACLVLARLYRKNAVYLFDQSIELYKAAVAQGSANESSVEASRELETIQRTDTTMLTQVGQLLYELAQYKAAEKYLMLALAKVPTDPQAQATLAAVKQSKPPEEDKDALASYTLGKLYEAQGALAQAKSQYEDALKKQPSYADAKDALKGLFKKKQTLEQRYLQLLRPAVRWLALELARRSMAANERDIPFGKILFARIPFGRIPFGKIFFKKRRFCYQAKLYNFIGEFHLSSAQEYRSFPFFYDMAISDFKKASKLVEDWYQPYENLADVYAEKGKKGGDSLSEDSQRQSRSNYGEALKNYRKALKLLDKDIPYLSIETHSERQKIERRILVNKAIVELLMGEELISEAKREIDSIVDAKPLSSELDSHLLYNLACWYALLADNQNGNDAEVTTAKDNACRYLAYSLARDEMLWGGASKDPDLKGIKDRLEDLLYTLRKKLQESPDLAKDSTFADKIKDVLEEAKRLSPKGDRKS